MVQTRRVHGVFAIPAAWLAREVAFAIAEHAAVLAMRERTAALDEGNGAMRLFRQETR